MMQVQIQYKNSPISNLKGAKDWKEIGEDAAIPCVHDSIPMLDPRNSDVVFAAGAVAAAPQRWAPSRHGRVGVRREGPSSLTSPLLIVSYDSKIFEIFLRFMSPNWWLSTVPSSILLLYKVISLIFCSNSLYLRVEKWVIRFRSTTFSRFWLWVDWSW